MTALAQAPDPDEVVEQRPLDLHLVRRFWRFTRPYAARRNVLLGLVVVRAIQLPLLGWVVGAVLSGPIAGLDGAGTLLGVAGFAGLAIVTEVVFHYRMRLALEFGEAVVHDLRNRIYEHLMRMPLAYFQAQTGRLGRIISRTISDVDAVRIGVQDVVFVGIVQLGTMMIAAALMIYYDRLLFLVVLALVPVLWKVLAHFRKKLTVAHRAVHESFSRVTSTLAQSVTGMKVTQGFAREDINGGLFRQLMDLHSKKNMEVVRHQAVFLPMLEFNGQLFIATLLAVGSTRALGHRLEIEAVVQFLFLSNLFFNPIPILGNLYNQALTAMAAVERVFHLLDTPPQWQDPPDAKCIEVTGRVEFRDVCFAYAANAPALQGVSFSAEPGQTIALVGPSGAGKSTIIALVAKFYLAQGGQILVDGEEIKTLSGDHLRRQMGSVFANDFLFSGTVMDNVRLGRPKSDERAIIESAKALDVLDLIEQLPNGWDTLVGQKGKSLSLGQRQIVCFTRAMLANPKVLLLDEATGAVDPLTQARLESALRKLVAGRTSFVVAHRLSTIRHADKVLVLQAGRIVEQGTHRELVDRQGPYARLYRSFLALAIAISPVACVDQTPPETQPPPPGDKPLVPEDIVFDTTDPVPPASRGVGANGPYVWKNAAIRGGGFVTGLVYSRAAPNLLYARTDVGGAYRYNITDELWVPLTDWVGQRDANLMGIESMAADPIDAARVYLAAGTYLTAGNGAVLASDNYGRDFTRHAIPVPMGGNVDGRSMGERLAVDPNQPEILYFASRNDGLWRSADRAASWARVAAFPEVGTPNIGLSFVTFDPSTKTSDGRTASFYVGVATNGGPTLFQTQDGGSSFAPVPDAPSGLMPHHAVIEARVMYLVYNDKAGPNELERGEIWRFDMQSGAWSNVSPPNTGGGFGGVSVDASRISTLMVTTMAWWAPDKVLRSIDSGASWRDIGERTNRDARGAEWLRFGGGSISATGWMGDIEIDPVNRSRVLYITGQGVWRSDNVTDFDANLATTWSFRNEGLEETVALDLACPPEGPELLSAVGDIAGFRHEALDTPSPTGMYTNPVFGNTTSIDFAELNPSFVVRVGTNNNPNNGGGRRGAYSADGGKTWAPFASEPADSRGSGSIAVSSDGTRLVWSAASASNNQQPRSPVSFSIDRGTTWTACSGIEPGASVAADRVNPLKFYTVNRQGLHVSIDGGQTFTLTHPVTNGGQRSSRVRPVFGVEGDVWLIINGALLRSTDSGVSVTNVPGVDSALAIGFGRAAQNGAYPAIYLSGSLGGVEGIFRSDDAGQTFSLISDERQQFGYVGHVTGDQRRYGRVYLGTGGRGILYGDPRN